MRKSLLGMFESLEAARAAADSIAHAGVGRDRVEARGG